MTEQDYAAKVRMAVEALDAYHPHEAPYVGGDASLPCNPKACAGGMRRAVLAILAAPAPSEPGLRERVVIEMENEGVVTWGDPRHRARFLTDDAAPAPSEPTITITEKDLRDAWLRMDHAQDPRTAHALWQHLEGAPAPSEPGLDVPTLRKAWGKHLAVRNQPGHWHFDCDEDCSGDLAAEYARLRGGQE